jgi:hypothetical protein
MRRPAAQRNEATMHADLLSDYDGKLQDLEAAAASLKEWARIIGGAAECLKAWPPLDSDSVGMAPVNWPDEERLVSAIGSCGRAKAAALAAWDALSEALREGLESPVQVIGEEKNP